MASLIIASTVAAILVVLLLHHLISGRAFLHPHERPKMIIGRRVLLVDLESGPAGLDRNRAPLPPAVVNQRGEVGYDLTFEEPVVWLGKIETNASVTARYVGHPISLAARPWRHGVVVAGKFGSGEAFVGRLLVLRAAR